MEKNRNVQAGLMIALEVGMVHDIARLTKLMKTYGQKVDELSEQIQYMSHERLASAEEKSKKEQQMIKRMQALNNIVREIHKMTGEMGQV
jgi:hypothetical protein